MDTNSFIKHALKYLNDFNFSVIPVGQDKKPLIKWEEYQQRKATKGEIEKWATTFKKANIGVVTGSISGIVVVDVETGGKTENLPPTVLSKTGGGGYHFFYKHPQKVVKNAVRIRDRTDIRGDGGFVVVPPSLHKSGNSYEWLMPPEEADFAPLPQWILQATTDSNPKVDWKLKVNEVVPQGSRNDTLASFIGKLAREIEPALWEVGIWGAAKEWNTGHNIPPLAESEVREVYESITKTEFARRVNEGSEKEISDTQTPDGKYTFEEISLELEKYLPNTTTALKIILAVVTSAARTSRVLLWVLLVGTPSSGKTDLVALTKKSEATFHLDNLTLNSFISGERESEKGKVYDLLPLLNKKCMVVKDWTVIFSLDERMTKKIVGDMVGAYDKTLSKFSSRRGNITYNAEFSHLGCITPATLNRHQNYLNMIGPRFLSYSIPELSESDENKSFKAIFEDDKSRKEVQKKLADMVTVYLRYLNNQELSLIKPLSKGVQNYLRIASLFMARARGIIIIKSASFTNDEGKNITYYEPLDKQIEQPWRAVQQLMFLSQCLALVVGHDEVGSEELEVIKDVVVSSMPADRSQALRIIKEAPDNQLTAKQLSEDVSFGKSPKTARRLLDELTFLYILKKDGGSGQIASNYHISDQFKDFISLHPREFMSSYSNGTKTPNSTDFNKQNDRKKDSGLDNFENKVKGWDTAKIEVAYETGKAWLDKNSDHPGLEAAVKMIEAVEDELNKREQESNETAQKALDLFSKPLD